MLNILYNAVYDIVCFSVLTV